MYIINLLRVFFSFNGLANNYKNRQYLANYEDIPKTGNFHKMNYFE